MGRLKKGKDHGGTYRIARCRRRVFLIDTLLVLVSHALHRSVPWWKLKNSVRQSHGSQPSVRALQIVVHPRQFLVLLKSKQPKEPNEPGTVIAIILERISSCT